MFLKDRILQELEKDESAILKIMTEIGADEYRTHGEGEYLFRTVCHGGKSFKLHYFPEDKQFHCYTDCSCNYSVFDLVSKVRNLDFKQSQRFIANILNISNSFQEKGFKDNSSEKDWLIINRYKRINSRPKEVNVTFRDKNIINLFKPMYHYSWIQEGMSTEALEKFNIRFDICENRIIIPHYNIDDELVGIRCRNLNQEAIDNGYKYMPIKIQGDLYSHETRYNLYGLNKTKESIKKLKKVTIFESEKSVILSESIYGDNNFSVALGGSSLTVFHRDLLLSLGIEEVILAMDKENIADPKTDKEIEDNINNIKKLMKMALMFAPYVRTYIVFDEEGLLDYKDSPIDKGKEVLEKLMKSKYEIKTQEGSE